MSEHKRSENRIRVSEPFKKYVLAHCGEDTDAGEWLEKEIKSSLRRKGKYEDYEQKIAKQDLEIERLKTQQPPCQPETNNQSTGPFPLAVWKPQETQTQDLAPSVLTATEIISPNTQTVTIGGQEIRVSNIQKEKAVWKDGQWTYSLNAAGNLALFDALETIRDDHIRLRESIKIEAKVRHGTHATEEEAEQFFLANPLLMNDQSFMNDFIGRYPGWSRIRPWIGHIAKIFRDEDGIVYVRFNEGYAPNQNSKADVQETAQKKYETSVPEISAPKRQCSAEPWVSVSPSTCETICQRTRCEHYPKTKQQTQKVSQFKCAAGDNVSQGDCLICQKNQFYPTCPKINWMKGVRA
jgi:hypothetical protein